MINKAHLSPKDCDSNRMNCSIDMCLYNIRNNIPCEKCPCYEEQKEGAE